MSLRPLPEIAAPQARCDHWDIPAEALAKWSGARAAQADDPATISIFDPIGSDFYGEGVRAQRIGAALRSIGAKPVTVEINSPGGDMFEGIAIFNLLREHPAEVNVRIMGLAASAASLVAMAGDRIEMGIGSMMMIHNAWGVVVGNRHDMAEAADVFARFDSSIRSIYAARVEMPEAEVAAMLDAETWLTAEAAVERGFADAVFEAGEAPAEKRGAQTALRKIETLLAAQGLPRAERRSLIREIAGTPCAAGPEVMPCAGLDAAGIARLTKTLNPHG